MIVNYVRECTAFIAYASDNKITANEFVLWHALFNAINQRAASSDWPDGFIPVSNSRLLSLTTFGAGKTGEETLRKTRDRLIQRGLIQYRAGEKNKRNPAYQMVFFAVTPEAGATVTPKILGNMTGNPQGNMQGNVQGNPQGILRKPNGNQTREPQTATTPQPALAPARGVYVREDGSITPARYDGAYLTSERARRAIAQRLLDGFAGQVDTSNTHGLLCEWMQRGMRPEHIEDALTACRSTGALEARLFALSLQFGLDGAQQQRELAQCRAAAAGNERLAQALYRMRTGQADEKEG